MPTVRTFKIYSLINEILHQTQRYTEEIEENPEKHLLIDLRLGCFLDDLQPRVFSINGVNFSFIFIIVLEIFREYEKFRKSDFQLDSFTESSNKSLNI